MTNLDLKQKNPRPEQKPSPYRPQGLVSEVFGCAADMLGEGWRIVKGAGLCAVYVAAAIGGIALMEKDKPENKEGPRNER